MKRLLVLAVDYGQKWPLSDSIWIGRAACSAAKSAGHGSIARVSPCFPSCDTNLATTMTSN